MPTLQEIKDQHIVLADQAYAEGVAAGQSGGPMFTQEQLDQAVSAARAAEIIVAAENLANAKLAIKQGLDASKVAETATEHAIVDNA